MIGFPKEILALIFSFLTPEEIARIIQVCKKFRVIGVDNLQSILRRHNLDVRQVTSLRTARHVLARPLDERVFNLYGCISEIESYLRGHEWNVQNMSRFHSIDTGSGTGYETSFLPLTLSQDHPVWNQTHFTTMTPDDFFNIRGESMRIGHVLRYRDNDRIVNWSVVVDIVEFLKAIRDLIDWLRRNRHHFLLLPDGTRFA